MTIQFSTGTAQASWLMTGRVIRVGTADLVVSVKGPKGEQRIERFSRRDGRRANGGAIQAEIVDAPSATRAALEREQQARQIDALCSAWRRNGGDVESLQQLHAAIGAYLEESTVRFGSAP